jgi:uroporphyrin-III C-methyltransferase
VHTIKRIVNDVPSTPVNPLSEPADAAPVRKARTRWLWLAAALLILLMLAASLALAWSAERRVRKLEQELVRRQQDSQTQSGEARLLAKRADETARESAAKVSLLEARLAEVAIQRTQLEDLIQSLSRSRDENVLVDIDAGLRVAQQQATITGSAEPMVAALKQADERLARYSQPRLEGVRRAIARDIDRVKAVSVPDISALSIKLDEAIRLVDELPLVSQPEPRKESTKPPVVTPKPTARNASGVTESSSGWSLAVSENWSRLIERIWSETRSLVRVTRIDHHDAMMLAPEQTFFLRENLKLRLLNARLALMARQFDAAQADLKWAQGAIERYFNRGSKRTQTAADLLRQVAQQARGAGVARPDDTLAALATVAAPRQ